MPASRRPLALAAAAATAAALGATALALPAVAAGSSGSAKAAPAAGAPTIDLKDGTLDWGFKESFRTYVAGGGKIEVAGGAKQAAGNGPFTFTNGKGIYDTSTHATNTAFDGSVLFTSAHFTIKLSDVRVITDRTSGSIQADITFNGALDNDVALAKLDMTKVRPGQGEGGAMLFKDIPATITAAGAKAFRYKEGDVLDSATLSVKSEGGGRPSPSPSTSSKPPVTEPSPSTSSKPPVTEPTPSASTSTKPTQPSGEPSTSTEPTAPAGEGEIVDGNLDWGVKERFREYVTGPIAHGKVELAAGAKKNGDIYRFPKAKGTFDAKTNSLAASFDGSVRFLGHLTDGAYLLDLRLSGLEVKVNGTQGSLIADVSTTSRAKGSEGKKLTYKDLKFATVAIPSGGLKATNNVVKLTGAATTLTADGVKAFDGMYKAGDDFDPLSLAVSLTEGAELPSTSGGGSTGGSTGGSGTSTGGGTTGGDAGGSVGGGSVGGSVGDSGALASTGSDIPTVGLIAAAAGVAAAGAGVVFAVRRRESANQS
ncbi:HtaA domain-containing protein [Streptomyces sp. NPDC005963]|uniref:HtaA domain-containing protein n=1 Tax=Streptomyces sp. NPDC005963 TaxID=3156721 RepID=UPI0033D4B82B